MTNHIKQWTATQDRDNLRLIPPLAEEFTVPGNDETIERARKWALDCRLLLADGVPVCAHGLYMMASCPKSTCRTNFHQLDHARIWVAAAEGFRPFLLSHSYSAEIGEEIRQYANAHGLDIMSANRGDDWYGNGALPIVMTMPDNYPVWPIEKKTALLLATQPVTWPGDES